MAAESSSHSGLRVPRDSIHSSRAQPATDTDAELRLAYPAPSEEPRVDSDHLQRRLLALADPAPASGSAQAEPQRVALETLLRELLRAAARPAPDSGGHGTVLSGRHEVHARRHLRCRSLDPNATERSPPGTRPGELLADSPLDHRQCTCDQGRHPRFARALGSAAQAARRQARGQRSARIPVSADVMAATLIGRCGHGFI